MLGRGGSDEHANASPEKTRAPASDIARIPIGTEEVETSAEAVCGELAARHDDVDVEDELSALLVMGFAEKIDAEPHRNAIARHPA